MQLKSSLKTGLAEQGAPEPWSCALQHMSWMLSGHRGDGVTIPMAPSGFPGTLSLTILPITGGTTYMVYAELPSVSLLKLHHVEVTPRAHRISLKT